jgi:hypothetical protein
MAFADPITPEAITREAGKLWRAVGPRGGGIVKCLE